VAITSTTFSSMVEAGNYQDEPRTVTIKFAALDLARPAGVAELYQRIRIAAAQVCRNDLASRSVSAPRAVRRCKQIAIGRAVQDVNNRQLSALHFAQVRSGQNG
jgi:UrcA family protein